MKIFVDTIECFVIVDSKKLRIITKVKKVAVQITTASFNISVMLLFSSLRKD